MNPALNYILSQQEPHRSILLHLQVVIEGTVPRVALKYKYKVPFYYFKDKPFCYLNRRKQFTDLCFVRGFDLRLHNDHLVAGEGRNTVKSLRYWTLEEVNGPILVDLLEEATLLY